MRNNGTLFDMQIKQTTKNKVILNCINTADTYCINKKQNNNYDDCGIIAAIGKNTEINYLIDINLDKPANRAHIDIKSLSETLRAPELNHGIFLNQIAGNTLFSLDVTYRFGVKVEHDLASRHEEYCKTQLIKNKGLLAVIQNKSKNKQY